MFMNASTFLSRAGFHTCRFAMESQPSVRVPLIALVLACGLLAICALLGASPALATGVIPTDPITNEVGVDLDADIVATYTGAISPTTVTTATFVAQGMMSGHRDGAFSFGGGDTAVTLDPAAGYFAGEVVRVSATAAISDAVGSPVTPRQWQFTAGPVLDRCAGGFTDIGAGLPGVSGSSVAWGDYDGDGDLDILLTGSYASQVWRNNGNGTFTDIYAGLLGMIYGAAAWGDYDNDGDLDILLVGNLTGNGIARVYRNNGGSFSEAASLTIANRAGADWGDYDNDGDLDILLTGAGNGGTYVAQVRRNDGGSFTNINAALTGMAMGSADWGDYDNDGDLDILLTGSNWNTSPYKFIRVWRNAGGGTFDLVYSLGFWEIGVDNSAAAWGDYDNDGYLDILLAGADNWGSGNRLTTIYHNNSGNGFSDIGAGLTGVYRGSVAWGDYDNDGDLDILLTGETGSSAAIARVYRNDGGAFTDIGAGLTGVLDSSAAWGDYDNDGDLDILLTGSGISKVYRNDDCPNLTKQVAPEAKVAYHDVVTYTVALNNTRGSATSLLLTDTLPAEVDFAGWLGDDHGATTTDGEIHWAGTVGAGEIITWTWTATHTGGYGEAVTNTARYDYTTGDVSDNDEAVFTVKTAPSLTITKTTAPGSLVGLNDPVTYTVVLQNIGETDTAGAVMTDVLPAQVGFVDWVEQNGATEASGTITWTGDVGAGAALTWTWTVTHSGSYGEVITNTARATDPKSAQVAEDDAVFQVKTAPSLTITKSVAPVQGVGAGELVTYTVTLSNTGESLAAGATMTDALPAWVGFAGWMGDNHGATVQNGAIAWTGDVDAGATLIWTWRVTVSFAGSGGVVTNTAWYRHTLAGVGSATATFPAGGPMRVESTDPVANGVGVATTPDIAVAFNAAIDQSTVTAGTFVAQGMMGGRLGGPYATAAETATLNPDRALFAGETVRVSLSEGLRATDGRRLLPYQWQFTAGPVLKRCNVDFADIDAGLPAVHDSASAWGDYDGDGDLDILLTGEVDASTTISRIYRNDGGGTFTDIGAGLPGVVYSSVAWGDYDNDGDLDILLTGFAPSTNDYTARVYRNDGHDTFTDIGAGLPGVVCSSVAWGDYDNDGDLDILLSGSSDSGRITQVYCNDGGSFTDIGAGLAGVYWGSVAWGDYDNDGDLDILLVGSKGSGSYAAQVYRNDDGNFTDIGAGLPGVDNSSAAWGDYDNDGDLDILLMGWLGGANDVITRVYRNDTGQSTSGGSFTDIKADLTGMFRGSAAWGDYDNDGDLDILLTGSNNEAFVTIIYRNDDGTFTDSGFDNLPVGGDGSAVWGDYDGDGDLDILVSGYYGGGTHGTEIIRNENDACPVYLPAILKSYTHS